jgi:hypothetical protein
LLAAKYPWPQANALRWWHDYEPSALDRSTPATGQLQ